jgi:iron-sulfur cluster assembly protein
MDNLFTITDKAKQKLIEFQMAEDKVDKPLRISVISGGCRGLERVMEWVDLKETDYIIDLEDFKVGIDKLAVLYLSGTVMDYTDGLNGKGFEWNTPNAKECSCGQSFSI